MRIACSNCSRSFDLDEQRLTGTLALQCVCGQRLPLRHEGAGQRLGKYTLLNRIAVGGMGEIYYGKVSGVEGFEKEVAIKKMLPHLSADRDFINMMVKEAKLTVLLNHPNVVGVYDLAKEGEEYYIAMEYVPGVTVGAILEQARRLDLMLPPEVPVHIIMQVLRGLGYAHNLPGPAGERLTILHRDITPQNILVTRHAFVKITDFGIAKAVNEISTTSPGMIKGKLGYIAPEQLEGKEPDQRVDLFCAAILLWEMCAVQRLFKGSTEIDTFRKISECKIPSLTQFRDDISPALESVIMRGLAKDPAARYSRAEEFASALSQAIFPRTADDYAEITEVFLGQHPDFFAAVDAHKGPPAEESTRAVPITGVNTNPGTPLEPVTKYVLTAPASSAPPTPASPAQKTSAAPWVVAVLLAVIAAVGGVVAWRLYNPIRAQPAQHTSMFPDPPPATSGLTPPTSKPAITPPAAGGLKPAPRPQHRDSGLTSRPLSEQEIKTVVQRHYANVSRCIQMLNNVSGVPKAITATIAIDMTGRVASVELNPRLTSENATKCLSGVLRNMTFRHHPDPDLKVNLPIGIRVLQDP